MSIRRDDIVNNIETRFKTISVANGYHTALGLNVFVWRTTSLDAFVLPAVIIRDVGQSKDQEGQNVPFSLDTWRLRMEIEIIGESGSATDALIRQMIADVYKAIGVDDTWSGKAITSFLTDDEIILSDQQLKTVGGATLRFEILYRTNKYQEN